MSCRYITCTLVSYNTGRGVAVAVDAGEGARAVAHLLEGFATGEPGTQADGPARFPHGQSPLVSLYRPKGEKSRSSLYTYIELQYSWPFMNVTGTVSLVSWYQSGSRAEDHQVPSAAGPAPEGHRPARCRDARGPTRGPGQSRILPDGHQCGTWCIALAHLRRIAPIWSTLTHTGNVVYGERRLTECILPLSPTQI